MRKHALLVATALLCLAFLSGPAGAATTIDPKADALLRAVAAHMQSLSAFSVTEKSLVDRVFPNGQKVAFFHKTAIKVARPDKLRAEAVGDDISGVWNQNGTAFQVYDATSKAYVAFDVPPRLAAALDMAMARLRLVGPMIDLLADDPYKSMMDGVLEAVYVGESEVGGKPCHHLALRQLTRDFELWVDAGKTPWPLRLAVTDKTLHGNPRTLVEYADWKAVSHFPAKTFAFTPPSDAVRVKLAAPAPAPAAGPKP
ncbi:Protein of unknown function DUF2092, periplasmic [Solidesulfovibrio fructosivorans JJ]]|uniref:Periplasmic protein n=1 Tax=Solidesulfovibrio fructosivorans JJ] TaxID=596151 RepID=E1JSQ2_SOLFR|nr:DUF2092 domain-containing protein [Solidesulfovibrio fructosivorans]EFL52535.1 Protein of unknown function DUF2092, periplasmic [Solidesulfovibrio fructosivorans JJ]]